MEVRHFRQFTRQRVSGVFAIGLVMIWGWLFSGGADDDYTTDEGTTIRYVERELMFLDSGRDAGIFVGWWTGQDRTLETLQDLRAVLQASPKSAGVFELLDQVEARISCERGDLGEPEIERYPVENATKQLQRSFLIGIIHFLTLPGALMALWLGRGGFRSGGPRWRLTREWSASLILVIFFGASILSDYLFFDVYLISIGSLLDPYWGWFLLDVLWRSAGPLFAVFVLTGSWNAIRRIFGFDLPVSWKPVAGVFCVLSLFDSITLMLGGGADVLDPGDFLLVADPGPGEIFQDFLTGVVVAPIFEELMFRGLLFIGLMRRIRPLPAALVSSFLFALVHTQYDPWGLLSVGVMGLGCCWLVWHTGSIKSGIALHAIYNLLITLDVYLLYQMPN